MQSSFSSLSCCVLTRCLNQSQGQGWERGCGGVAGDPGMGEQGGYTRGISTTQLGW